MSDDDYPAHLNPRQFGMHRTGKAEEEVGKGMWNASMKALVNSNSYEDYLRLMQEHEDAISDAVINNMEFSNNWDTYEPEKD